MIKLSLTEVKSGDSAEIEKKMTLEMVKNFASISEDYNPVHLDEEYASKTRFKRQIIHGLMATSLFSGLFGTKLPGEGCVYKSQNIRFKRPVYIDDVVLARVEIDTVDVTKKVISFSTKCYVNGKVVIEGEAEIFVP